jgi:serine/threonine protein kinase
LARVAWGKCGRLTIRASTALSPSSFLHATDGSDLQREARAIAALNHPHICTIYDIGPDYLVMEFIEGKPLPVSMATADAIRFAEQIADALAAAHSKGIIHRDLKPDNILVTATGVKLLDFGLAKLQRPGLASDADTITATISGTLKGTIAYMSPEQAQGRPLDVRSDIFSFGLVFYEMLSGKRAFQGETLVDTLAAILRDEPKLPDAPQHLREIIDRLDVFRANARLQETQINSIVGVLELKPRGVTTYSCQAFIRPNGDRRPLKCSESLGRPRRDGNDRHDFFVAGIDRRAPLRCARGGS